MEAAATTELRSKKLQLEYVNCPPPQIESAFSGASFHVRIHILINSSGIVASRKRKLREFYAVCDNGYQLPQYSVSANPSPINPDERRFLEVSDILQYVPIPMAFP